MLVLTRKLGENIRIGDVIKVTVLEVRSGQVKLGVDAPKEIKVHREEIYERIQAENRRQGLPPLGQTSVRDVLGLITTPVDTGNKRCAGP